MPRIRKFNKNTFRGNQHSSKTSSVATSTSAASTPGASGTRPSPKKSSSSKKLKGSKLPQCNTQNTSVNFIVDLENISNLVKSFSICKYCMKSESVEVRLDHNFKKGLVHRILIVCSLCGNAESAVSSKYNNRTGLYDLNARYIYALRSIGKGLQAGKMFSAVMNIAPPSVRLEAYHDKLLQAATDVCGASLHNAAREAVEENDGCADVAAAFDGTWQKRGHTSLNGVITVTSFDTGKVLDFECISKYCNICVRKPYTSDPRQMALHKEQNKCSANYSGSSGGMEVMGATALCGRSKNKLGLRYTKYLGDGDSKGFAAALESKPYGDNIEIEKLECVGHIQKRVGTRLRRLKKDLKGVKLSDGKPIGGKGRLTDIEIDNLQRYYGSAIRKNLTNTQSMRKAIKAMYYHKISTDARPRHNFCPSGSDTWCKFNKAKQNNTEYEHKKSLPTAVMKKIKPVLEDLSEPELLKRCLHGKTQNPNESFNSVIWQRLPKTVFVGIKTLKLGVTDSVITFNDGSIAKANVLERLGIEPGKFTIDGLTKIDQNRINKADREVQEENKKKRIRRRLTKRKLEDSDCEEYIPGGF